MTEFRLLQLELQRQIALQSLAETRVALKIVQDRALPFWSQSARRLSGLEGKLREIDVRKSEEQTRRISSHMRCELTASIAERFKKDVCDREAALDAMEIIVGMSRSSLPQVRDD